MKEKSLYSAKKKNEKKRHEGQLKSGQTFVSIHHQQIHFSAEAIGCSLNLFAFDLANQSWIFLSARVRCVHPVVAHSMRLSCEIRVFDDYDDVTVDKRFKHSRDKRKLRRRRDGVRSTLRDTVVEHRKETG